jgi:hypothetical protein
MAARYFDCAILIIEHFNFFWRQNKIIEALKKAENRRDSSNYDDYPIYPT